MNGITNGASPAAVLPNGRSSVRISGVMERELEPIAGFPLRRAVLGILLEAGTALTVHEVVERLHAHGRTTMPHLTKAPAMVISDLLRYQKRIGRVERVARGRYRLATAFSRSTEWRYRNWRRLH